MIDLVKHIPPMLFGKELKDELAISPKKENYKTKAEAFSSLDNIYEFYYPLPIASEIYSKMYLSLVHSLQKKTTRLATKQKNINGSKSLLQENNAVIGGGQCFSIIGHSGLGKSRTINRIISVISKDKIITIKSPFTQIIPFLTIQCPFDCSVKNLFLNILFKIDEQLNTNYYKHAVSCKATTDMIINQIANVSVNHIGVLIIDEIQQLCNKNDSEKLLSCLTQLINSSGISIVLVGTPEAVNFLNKAEYIARRSLGFYMDKMPYNDTFVDFLDSLWNYQYTPKKIELSQHFIEWFYEHTQGTISSIISLFHDVQEYILTNDLEKISIEVINIIYERRFITLKQYISTKKHTYLPIKNEIEQPKLVITKVEDLDIFSKLLTKAKKEHLDYYELLKQHITIEEIAL